MFPPKALRTSAHVQSREDRPEGERPGLLPFLQHLLCNVDNDEDGLETCKGCGVQDHRANALDIYSSCRLQPHLHHCWGVTVHVVLLYKGSYQTLNHLNIGQYNTIHRVVLLYKGSWLLCNQRPPDTTAL